MSGAVGFRDFLKAAALPFHIAQPSENIFKDGGAAHGGNAGQITLLYPCAVFHTTGRIDSKTVIVNVDVNLATQNQIIPMAQCIDKRLKNASFAVVWHLNTGIGGFLPARFHIPLDKADALIEQNDQAADFDPVELYKARQAIRPAQEKAAEQQLEDTMHEKPSLIMLLRAKQETSHLLGADAEERQARQLIMHRNQEQYRNSLSKRKRNDPER